MKNRHPVIASVALAFLLTAGLALCCSGLFMDDSVEISEEKVYASYSFARDVLEDCPIEKAELNKDSHVVTVYFPREEYRDLRARLRYSGWAEQGEESGEFHHDGEVIRVSRGELSILPHGLAGR